MLNQVSLVGRLTKKPELSKTTTGKSVSRFTLACKTRDKTDFVPCVTWNQSAEFISKYGDKGDVFAGSGHLSVSTYEKDGKKVSSMEVVLDNVSKVSSSSKKEFEFDE